MTPTARKVADAINRLYGSTPLSTHDAIDSARDEIGNALALDGQCSTSKFNDVARTRRP